MLPVLYEENESTSRDTVSSTREEKQKIQSYERSNILAQYRTCETSVREHGNGAVSFTRYARRRRRIVPISPARSRLARIPFLYHESKFSFLSSYSASGGRNVSSDFWHVTNRDAEMGIIKKSLGQEFRYTSRFSRRKFKGQLFAELFRKRASSCPRGINSF